VLDPPRRNRQGAHGLRVPHIVVPAAIPVSCLLGGRYVQGNGRLAEAQLRGAGEARHWIHFARKALAFAVSTLAFVFMTNCHSLGERPVR
jgi:hypothetical protein